MCINCNCNKCINVKLNMENGIWYHLSDSPKLKSMNLGDTGNLYDLFPDSILGLKKDNFIILSKPQNTIWCSAGSWLYDCYHEGDHDEIAVDINCLKITINDNNYQRKILRIRNIDELTDFNNNYLLTYNIDWE